ELISLEAQLEVQRRYSGGGNSKTRDLEYRVVALRNRMQDLMTGSTDNADGGMLRSFSEMPGLGRMLADLMIEAKTHEAVYTLLSAQYQQSRIEEARNSPTVQVLDRASPPPFRDTPRRKLNLIIGLVIGVGGGCLLAFALEYVERSLTRPGMSEVLPRLGRPWTSLPGALARLRTS
ncbi:MAG: lipopolysaccharide biosynthesis protein, partial [bacterium]